MKKKIQSNKFNKSHQSLAKELPDVAFTPFSSFSAKVKKSKREKENVPNYPLERVGMHGLETIVNLVEDKAVSQKALPAKVDIVINLVSPTSRGIHMSRLYKIIFSKLSNNPLTPTLIFKILQEAIISQERIANFATIKLDMVLVLKRNALISKNQGYRHYPITWKVEYDAVKKQFFFTHQFKLLYSSTCPCSTALAVNLQEKRQGHLFTDFIATPHAQRSEADITLVYKKPPVKAFMVSMIDYLEQVIATPVQTAVKREDEQEFARLNAEHLMFCEDAARLLKHALEKEKKIADYRIKVSHLESLHAHNAVAITVKGVSEGLTP